MDAGSNMGDEGVGSLSRPQNPISHTPPQKPLSYIIRLCSKLADEPHRPHPRARRGPRPHPRIQRRARRARPRPRRLRVGAGAEKAPQGWLVARQTARLYRGAGRQRLGRHRRAMCRHVRILRLSPAPCAGGRGVRPRLVGGDRRGVEEIDRRCLRTRAGRHRRAGVRPRWPPRRPPFSPERPAADVPAAPMAPTVSRAPPAAAPTPPPPPPQWPRRWSICTPHRPPRPPR